jgi:archaeosine-15-forming tRNA-guanine transglycosylase
MSDEEEFIRSKEEVILVDKNDKEIGVGEKLKELNYLMTIL